MLQKVDASLILRSAICCVISFLFFREFQKIYQSLNYFLITWYFLSKFPIQNNINHSIAPHWRSSYQRCSVKETALKDTLEAFEDFKNKQQKGIKWCLMFFICKSIYISKVYSIYYALGLYANVKKVSFGQNKC